MKKKNFSRIEEDSLGKVEVPQNKYWGAQTQRSIKYFYIGSEKIPDEMIHSLAVIKKAAAITNMETGILPKAIGKLIVKAAEEVISSKLNDNFPLVIWQTGSGTHTNMNVNEVIASRANEIATGNITGKNPVHPNDHVNMCQSSNDVFPSAMNIASAKSIMNRLLPALFSLKDSFVKKELEFINTIKVGRTHLQDAVPITLGQEFSGYSSLIEESIINIEFCLESLFYLPLGATAVGTGLNAHPKFAVNCIKHISELTGISFKSAPNKFSAISMHNGISHTSSALRILAESLMKIANDIRWMASGPRCGLGEIKLPENEPGSSIMPGKVNPSQCEALTMVCVQVMGNDSAVSIANSQGNFELNVYKPVMIYNLLQSVNLLTQAVTSFNFYCVKGIKANKKRIKELLDNSLMTVTALTPKIGYDKASKISRKAYEDGTDIKTACLKLDLLTEKEFDNIINLEKLV